jgi:hypothetical protein
MKNDSRDASSMWLMRYAVPGATLEESRSMRNRNCELTSSRLTALWMPRSKLPSLGLQPVSGCELSAELMPRSSRGRAKATGAPSQGTQRRGVELGYPGG